MTKADLLDLVAVTFYESRKADDDEFTIAQITEAIWKSFILFHQGEKAELPEGPQADSAYERLCLQCGARGPGGYITFARGAVMCLGCLEDKKKESQEAREFWERAFIANAASPKELRAAEGHRTLLVEEFADKSLAHWLARFGSRNA